MKTLNLLSNNICVSIWCPTYNHEKFIEATIKGFLLQKTNFNFEIVIHDDASKDNAANIIRQYQKENPQKIKAICQTENKYSQDKSYLPKVMLKNCVGKYIAMCEGDDYWTDENKLQKQVDFLEANPDYAICFHEAKKLFDGGSTILFNNISNNTSFDFLDLTQRNFISTASCVFRVYDHLHPLPDWFSKLSAGDWGLHLLNASRGKIFFMKDCMSVYRIHSVGMWSSMSSEEACNTEIKIMDDLNEAFNYEYDKYFAEGKAKRLASYKEHLQIKPPIQKESFSKRVKKHVVKYFR